MGKNFTRGPFLIVMFGVTVWAISTIDIRWTTDMVAIITVVSGLIIALIVYLLKTGKIRVRI